MNEIKTEFNKDSSYNRIFFKQINECGGRYEISNMGHVRSNYGKRKILKAQKHYNNMRLNLYDENGKMHTYNIKDLMAKYWNVVNIASVLKPHDTIVR